MIDRQIWTPLIYRKKIGNLRLMHVTPLDIASRGLNLHQLLEPMADANDYPAVELPAHQKTPRKDHAARFLARDADDKRWTDLGDLAQRLFDATASAEKDPGPRITELDEDPDQTQPDTPVEGPESMDTAP